MFRLEKKILSRDPPLVKEKFLTPDLAWYMFRLGKKFLLNDPPPPVKGKIFDTRFGLIHVQTGKKIFVEGPPPSFSKGKIFWHQIWLDTCSDWEKIFCWGTPPRNSKKLLWPRGGRYASCVHAGGLSCVIMYPSNRIVVTSFFRERAVRWGYKLSLSFYRSSHVSLTSWVWLPQVTRIKWSRPRYLLMVSAYNGGLNFYHLHEMN